MHLLWSQVAELERRLRDEPGFDEMFEKQISRTKPKIK
jgi:hypothetical protein